MSQRAVCDLPALRRASVEEDVMHHKRIGSALVTVLAFSACARPSVETAGGEISTPATPANARSLPVGSLMDLTLDQPLAAQSSRAGDNFSATVANAVIARTGRTTVPAGAKVWGHIKGIGTTSSPAQSAALVLDFDSLTFNGREYPFSANITATTLPTQRGASTSQPATSGGFPAGSRLSVQTTRNVTLHD
jgi:hypothetical protein